MVRNGSNDHYKVSQCDKSVTMSKLMRFKKKNVKFQVKGTTLVRTLNLNFFELTLIVKTLNPGRFGSINEFHMLVR